MMRHPLSFFSNSLVFGFFGVSAQIVFTNRVFRHFPQNLLCGIRQIHGVKRGMSSNQDIQALVQPPDVQLRCNLQIRVGRNTTQFKMAASAQVICHLHIG
ncbi:hypothetical protein D3C73_738740 [compost metagenome]